MRLLRHGFLRLSAAFLALAGVRPVRAADAALSSAVIERCKEATVLVDLGKAGSGSGFLVHSSGLFATNRHVIEGIAEGATVKVVLNPGQPGQQAVQAHVAAVSQDADLALLKTDEIVKAAPLPLAGDAGLVELTPVVVFGYPFGKMLASGGDAYPTVSVNAGAISSLRRVGRELDKIQIDAATNPGNSGGPVIDKNGRVIGVIVSGIPGAQVNFAIPAAKLIAMVNQPVLCLHGAAIGYSRRGEPKDFEVEAIPIVPIPPDAALTMEFGPAGAARRAFTAVRKDGKFLVHAAPCDTAGAGQQRLRVEAFFGLLGVCTNLDDCPLHVGGRQLWLSEVRDVQKENGAIKTTLVHRDKEAGRYEILNGMPAGLPSMRGELNPGITVNLQDADYLKVSSYDPGAARTPYRLVLSSHGKPVAENRGVLEFADPPLGLARDDRAEDRIRQEGGSETEDELAAIMFGQSENQGFRIDPLIDPAHDARQGTWTRRDGLLQTSAEPGAWCEIPALPTGDYWVRARIIPNEDNKGELLLQLPVGKARALLHVDGGKGAVHLDLTDSAAENAAHPDVRPFHKGKPQELTAMISTAGDFARVIAQWDNTQPLVWIGNINELAVPKDSPVPAGRLAIGHRGLRMAVDSIRLRAPDGGMHILRDLPNTVDLHPSGLVGHWTFDSPITGNKMPSLGGGAMATLIGSPQLGASPAAAGPGALKLGNEPAGFQLEENIFTNAGPHDARTIALWFKPDAPAAPDRRQYLFAEGADDKGFAIYLQNGTLFAGGWDEPAGWKGTWLKAPGIAPGKWRHAALVLSFRLVASGGKNKRSHKEYSLALFLDGSETGRGEAHSIGPHAPMTFGIAPKATEICFDDPTNATAADHPFPGLIDEAIVYNVALSATAIKILAGASFAPIADQKK